MKHILWDFVPKKQSFETSDNTAYTIGANALLLLGHCPVNGGVKIHTLRPDDNTKGK